jgi:hypothetical protein
LKERAAIVLRGFVAISWALNIGDKNAANSKKIETRYLIFIALLITIFSLTNNFFGYRRPFLSLRGWEKEKKSFIWEPPSHHQGELSFISGGLNPPAIKPIQGIPDAILIAHSKITGSIILTARRPAFEAVNFFF